MRINKILESNGFKLIAATLLLYPTDKTGIDYFWDYKDGILRVFTGVDHITYPIPTWREALTFIRRGGNWWEYRPRIPIPGALRPGPGSRPRNAWKEVDPPNDHEPSADTRYYRRVIRLPFSHWNDRVRQTVNRWIESNSWRQGNFDERCDHDYDCCGCLIGQSAQWTYSFGKLTLFVTRSYNY